VETPGAREEAMTNRAPITIPIAIFALAWAILLPGAGARAQDPPAPAAYPLAPVPPALRNAKKVFLSNAGADSGLFPHPFSGDPDRPYNEFYAALKTWNRYDLVGDPADADLVFELQLTAPYGPSNPSKPNGAADPLPMFRLAILDRKTHYVLWTLTESVDLAYLQKTHDHNFDQALGELVLDLKRLTAATAAGDH
jgi:hypothetical protein